MSEIRIGLFGAWRGNSYRDLILQFQTGRVDLVAVCDKKMADVSEEERNGPLKGVALFEDFDSFLAYGKSVGMNAVFLANYFHQHAPYAIRAMEAGMNVISECTAASTLKECVELVEAVERTGRKYMLAENYPFTAARLKMAQLIQRGELGTLLYAEGEYNHSGNNEELARLTPGKYHWRGWMPRTYYVTHALGPVMYMTGSTPRYVSARAAHSDLLYQIRDMRHNYDGVGMMFCEMDNGMIARVTGCTAMASDYSRYRVTGDVASLEEGGNVPGDLRMFWFEHTRPEGQETQEKILSVDPAELGERDLLAANAGHGGGDFRVLDHMVDYFTGKEEPFFDVYRAVAMSATGILGWRSCLNHGENLRIPDFRIKEERDAVRNDDLTPFPDENGNGITLPCALPVD